MCAVARFCQCRPDYSVDGGWHERSQCGGRAGHDDIATSELYYIRWVLGVCTDAQSMNRETNGDGDRRDGEDDRRDDIDPAVIAKGEDPDDEC